MASLWLHSALLVPLSAFAGAAWLSYRAPDLSGVKTTVEPKVAPLHDLASHMEQTVFKQNGPVEITEGELNDFFLKRLHGTQTGISGLVAQFDRVLFDLEEGRARLHVCWSILGHPMVTSFDFTVERTETDFTVEVKSGAYGRLEVSRGLLLPMTPLLEKLAATCKPEIDALFKLPKIRIAQDKLILDPSFAKPAPPKTPPASKPADAGAQPPKTSSSATPRLAVPPFAI